MKSLRNDVFTLRQQEIQLGNAKFGNFNKEASKSNENQELESSIKNDLKVIFSKR